MPERGINPAAAIRATCASDIFSANDANSATGLPVFWRAISAAAITHSQASGSHRSLRGKSTTITPKSIGAFIRAL